MKKNLLCLFLCFFYAPLQGVGAEVDTDIKTKQLLNYSISLGLGYQSFSYYNRKNLASENFVTLDLFATYYATSFFSLSYQLGVGLVSFYNTEKIAGGEDVFFPTKIKRVNVSTSLQAEFFGFVSPDSLIYFGFGPSFVYLPDLLSTGTSTSTYPDTQRNILSLKLLLGSRFALYEHTLMDAHIYILLPFQKMKAWSDSGSKKYHEITLGFELAIGFFD